MTRNTGLVFVTTTVKYRADAKRLARRILTARLAACVQWMPIQSIYWWKGAVEEASEFLLLAKTRRTLAHKLTGFIRKHHPYELPEITVCPIEGGLREYLHWIREETVSGNIADK